MRDSDSQPGDIDSLLEPSLEAGSARVGLYSTNSAFIVAFFGGPFAILCYSGLNSVRLNRLNRDLWLYLLIGVTFAVAAGWASHAIASGASLEVMGLTSSRTVRYGSRAIALAVFGLLYLRLRPFYRAASLSDVEPPNPWPAGLACLGVGIGLSFAATFVGAMLAR